MPDLLAKHIARVARHTSPYLLRRSCPNFFWSVLWQFTAVCNARCLYCTQRKETSHPDVFGVFQKVKKLRPKDILLMGGEPYLYPDIIELLSAIEGELGDPYLTISTNLAVDMDVVRESLPFLDQVQVSIDGMEAINKRVRSFDGDEIAGRIRELADYIRGERLSTTVFTHSVVTAHSLEGIEDFVERMQALVPGIEMGFSLVEPYGHPLSFAGDRERMRTFLATIIRLKERFPVNVCDRLIPPTEPKEVPVSCNFETPYEEDYRVAEKVRCRRQYFFAFISPAGDVVTCRPYLFYYQYRGIIKKLVQGGRYLEAARTVLRMVDQLLIRLFEPTCYFPCKCQRFVEDVLESVRRPEITAEIARIAGKFNRAELERAQSFLRTRFNDPLPPEVVKVLLGEEEAGSGDEQ